MSFTGFAVAALLLTPVQDIAVPFGVGADGENEAFSRAAPEECAFYLRWASSRATGESDASPTERLLADPEVQRFLLSIGRIANESILESGLADTFEGRFILDELNELVPMLMTQSGVIIVNEIPDTPTAVPNAVLVMDLGDSEERVTDLLARVSDEVLGDVATRRDWGDGVMYSVSREVADLDAGFGIRDGMLFLSIGEDSADAIVKNMESPAPDWLVDLEGQMDFERRAYLGRIDLAAIWDVAGEGAPPDFTEFATAIGFDRLQSIQLGAGYQNDQFVSRTRLVSDGVIPKALIPISTEPLTVDDLEFVPADAGAAFAVNIDVPGYIDAVLDAVALSDPELAEEVRQEFAGETEDPTEMNYARIVASLGETLVAYYSPREGGSLFGFIASMEVNDVEALRGEEEKLVDIMRTWGAYDFDRDPWEESFFRLQQREFMGETVYYLVPDSFFNLSPFAVAWCITDDNIMFAPYPQNICAVLAREESTETLASHSRVEQLLDGRNEAPSAIAFVDGALLYRTFSPYAQIMLNLMSNEFRHEGFALGSLDLPSGFALSQHMEPDVAALYLSDNALEIESHLTLPGTDVIAISFLAGFGAVVIQEAGLETVAAFSPRRRERTQAVENLKMIAIAMHNYHDVHRRLPAAYSSDKDGEPLLSWRVQLLPYLEEWELYDEFRLDEPWDSEHNIQLVERMPDIFRAPGSAADEFETNYLTIRNVSGPFPGEDARQFGDVHDGLSNTLMVVEASDEAAVIWTKPDDAELDPMKPMRLLSGSREPGFLAALGDGSVVFFPESLGADEIFRWIGIQDGEVNQFVPQLAR